MTTAAIDRSSAVALAERCRTDSSYFSRAVLGQSLWSGQLAIKRSARRHRRTLVVSGHGTGKTRTLAEIVAEHMAFTPNANVVCTASTNAQVHQVLWTQVAAIHARARARGIPLGGDFSDRIWRGATPDSFAVAKSVDDPTAMHGVHGPAVLVVVDEAEGVDRKMWRAIESLLLSEGSRLVVAFNPWDPEGYCAQAASRPDVWNVVHLSALSHPNVVSGENVIPGAVTREWVDEMRRLHGEDSDEWRVQVEGRFPRAGSRQLISADMLDATAGGGLDQDEEPRAGLDVARFGGDRNVIVATDQRRRVVAVDSWVGLDLMETAGRALEFSRSLGAALRVDACGMGAGVVDRLREQGVSVDAVDFGTSPAGDWSDLLGVDAKFANRKAELHWALRENARRRLIEVPAKFRELRADLCAPTYGHDSTGRIKVEDKDAIRKRIGRSPDFGDALVIALSNAGFSRPEDFLW